MAKDEEPVVGPLLRFQYAFDAEVLDDEVRHLLAGAPTERKVAGAATSRLMSEIRTRFEAALTTTAGLRVGRAGFVRVDVL